MIGVDVVIENCLPEDCGNIAQGLGFGAFALPCRGQHQPGL